MKSIKPHSHIGLDGVLRLQVPEDLKDMDVTLFQVWQQIELDTHSSNVCAYRKGFI